MCGISGIFAPDIERAELAAALGRMADVQSHRGPDSQATYVLPEGRIGLAHNRLAILDLGPTGHQPMANADQRQIICYNGEVYNFIDLRRLLENERAFVGHSDTEVVLAAFERWGTDSFRRLNGMFAFAIVDRPAGKLYLVRDRLGIKPLYFARLGNRLAFSSEIKGILSSGLFPVEEDLSCLHEFLYFGSTLGKQTFFKGIEQLLPGTFLEVDLSTGAVSSAQRYWSVNDLPSGAHIREEEATSKTRELLDKAVKRQLVSDVPIGAFLSGGVDSSAMVALASKYLESKLRTYSVGFDYMGTSELPLARKVANRFNTEHHEIYVEGTQIEGLIERLGQAHDQPFADPANLPLFQLCEALGGEQKVVLQGDGGDELFGGYRRYIYLRSGNLGKHMASLADFSLDALRGHYGRRVFGAHRFLLGLSQSDPAERMGLLLSVEGPLNPPTRILNSNMRQIVEQQDPFKRYREIVTSLPRGDDLQMMLHTDLQILLPDIFLQKVDRPTMATSTEVRVPFLDFDLVDYVAALPSSLKVGFGQRKKLLRSVLAEIVPPEVLNAPKRGFGVPISGWLAGPLRRFAQDRILAQSGRQKLFEVDAVNQLFDEHASGHRNHAQLLWKALQIAIWREGQQFG